MISVFGRAIFALCRSALVTLDSFKNFSFFILAPMLYASVTASQMPSV